MALNCTGGSMHCIAVGNPYIILSGWVIPCFGRNNRSHSLLQEFLSGWQGGSLHFQQHILKLKTPSLGSQKRLDTWRASSCWSGVLSVHGVSTSVDFLQIAAGGGDRRDGLKGYCCVCNLTSDPHLRAIFAEVIYEPVWHRVAARTKVILQLLACFILWL